MHKSFLHVCHAIAACSRVSTFQQAFMFLHYIILVPLQSLVVLLLLWFYIGLGPSCLPGLVLLLLQLPMQYALSSIFMYLR